MVKITDSLRICIPLSSFSTTRYTAFDFDYFASRALGLLIQPRDTKLMYANRLGLPFQISSAIAEITATRFSCKFHVARCPSVVKYR